MLFFPLEYWLFLLPGFLLAAYASWKVRSTYASYSEQSNVSGLRGVDVAARMARALGLKIYIEETPGTLSDHYDPSAKTVRLSSENYHGRSVAALAVAAHEVGHAWQDHEGNAMLRLRSSLAPLASFGSNAAWILLMLGMLLQATGLIWAGIFAFGAAVLFHVVTLPVELDASAKAKRALAQMRLVRSDEAIGVKAVLSAAALTYVAGALTAALQLAYYVMQAIGLSNHDEA
jgi:Zn-dependent membrane protease YugP